MRLYIIIYEFNKFELIWVNIIDVFLKILLMRKSHWHFSSDMIDYFEYLWKLLNFNILISNSHFLLFFLQLKIYLDSQETKNILKNSNEKEINNINWIIQKQKSKREKEIENIKREKENKHDCDKILWHNSQI